MIQSWLRHPPGCVEPNFRVAEEAVLAEFLPQLACVGIGTSAGLPEADLSHSTRWASSRSW